MEFFIQRLDSFWLAFTCVGIAVLAVDVAFKHFSSWRRKK